MPADASFHAATYLGITDLAISFVGVVASASSVSVISRYCCLDARVYARYLAWNEIFDREMPCFQPARSIPMPIRKFTSHYSRIRRGAMLLACHVIIFPQLSRA
jgi:hypothetical protein